jgi:hypothetical protein
MTRDEMRVVLHLVKTSWPHSFRNATVQTMTDMLNLWSVAFQADDAATVTDAVWSLVNDGQRFAPTIGEVRAVMKPKAVAALPSSRKCPLVMAHAEEGTVGQILRAHDSSDPLCQGCERLDGNRCWRWVVA